jgi:perosamine synthetase
MVVEPEGAQANYWLNALLLADVDELERFVVYAQAAGVILRPLWELTNHLPMYNTCQTDDLRNSQFLSERLVNIPSSVV